LIFEFYLPAVFLAGCLEFSLQANMDPEGGAMTEGKDIYRLLAERIKAPDSRLIPQLFRMLVDDQEAEILLALPAIDTELASRFGMEISEMKKKLKSFFEKGLVIKSKTPEGITYRLCRDVIQFHDATNIWSDASLAYHDLWERFMEQEWPEHTKVVENSMSRPFFRIIPVEESISFQSRVLAYESCQDVIEACDQIAVTRCPCRIRARKCSRPEEICIQMGKAAEYALDRGTGRQVSKKEAMQLLRQAEEAGLVHNTLNKADGMYFICNCCGCCCIALRSIIKEGRQVTDPSRFLAKVDGEVCTACKACEDRCYFGAIEVQEKGGKAVACVNPEKCLGCGICRINCPDEAITLEEVRKEEFIPAKHVPAT